MARQPIGTRPTGVGTPPEAPKGEPDEYSQGVPISFYPSVRHLIEQVAAIGTKVDRLIDDVKGQRKDIDALRLKAAEAEGTFKAYSRIGGGLILLLTIATLVVGILSWRNPQPVAPSPREISESPASESPGQPSRPAAKRK